MYNACLTAAEVRFCRAPTLSHRHSAISISLLSFKPFHSTSKLASSLYVPNYDLVLISSPRMSSPRFAYLPIISPFLMSSNHQEYAVSSLGEYHSISPKIDCQMGARCVFPKTFQAAYHCRRSCSNLLSLLHLHVIALREIYLLNGDVESTC